MKREIKFRVWDYQNNRWAIDKDISGSIGLVFGTNDYFINIAGEKSLRFAFMQFTGLKDKNGNGIYEGDWYQVAKNKTYQVRYSEGGIFNNEFFGGCFVLWANEELFFPFDEYAIKNGEVIGNIYQNPELLK